MRIDSMKYFDISVVRKIRQFLDRKSLKPIDFAIIFAQIFNSVKKPQILQKR